MCCNGIIFILKICCVIFNFQVKAGKVYATATEDMDALTFGSNVLLRHLTFSEARKMPIQEIYLDKVLEGLKLSHSEVLKSISRSI